MATMIIAGEQVSADELREVRSPFDNKVVDTVPLATPADVDRTLDNALIENCRKNRDHEALELYICRHLMGI